MTRVLLITRNLPPLVGGMEQLNWHMTEELSKAAEVHVVGPAGSAALAPAGVEVHEVPLKPLPRFLLSAGARARREARRWKPDVVLAGSGLTAPLALRAARLCGAKSAVYVHGLDVAVQSFLYRLFWLPALRRVERVIANSHATAELCRAAGVPAERIGIVHPGVSLPAEIKTPAVADQLRAGLDLGDRPVLLSVGRLTARKGLREFVTQCLPLIVAKKPEVLLLVVGEAPKHSLHAKAQNPEDIQAAANAAGLGRNLKFIGVITDRELLAALYKLANVHVFPVREIPGDPEGFGMVAVEAAAHGLPTVAFATGGVVDAVSEGKSGHLVAPGDYTAFASVTLRTLDECGTLRAGCAAFARQFAWPHFGEQVSVELFDTRYRPHPESKIART